MDNEKKTYEYETKSIKELAVLLCLGADLTKVIKGEERFLKFALKADFDLEAKALELASGKLMVNANDLLSAYERSKSIIHSHK